MRSSLLAGPSDCREGGAWLGGGGGGGRLVVGDVGTGKGTGGTRLLGESKDASSEPK